jgi:hypothetical protein
MAPVPQPHFMQLFSDHALFPTRNAPSVPDRQVPGDAFAGVLRRQIDAENAHETGNDIIRRPELHAPEHVNPQDGQSSEPAWMRGELEGAPDSGSPRPEISDKKENHAQPDNPRENSRGETGKGESNPVMDGKAGAGPERVQDRDTKETGKRGEDALQASALAAPPVRKENTATPHVPDIVASARRLLSSIERMPRQGEQVRELKHVLGELRELLAKPENNAGGAQRTPASKGRLEALLQNIERALSKPGERGILTGLISDLKREVNLLAESMPRRAAQSGVRVAEKTADVEPRTPAPVERLQFAVDSTRSTGSEARQDGGEQGMNSHQFRAETSSPRQAQTGAQNALRGGDFSRQLESLLDNARVVVRDSRNGSFSMSLNPESLGRVTVNLGLEDGVISGRFLVESREAKDALMENLDSMRGKLEEAGIAVGDFQVNVRDEHRRFSQSDEMNSGTGSFRDFARDEEREYTANAMKLYDSSIDVIA